MKAVWRGVLAGCAALAAGPLWAAPLWAAPLWAAPLWAAPLWAAPLWAAPLWAAPLWAAPLTTGFYLPWDEASRTSLIAHAAALDVLAPMSGALDSPQGHLRWQADPALAQVLAARGRRPKVLPIVSNAHDEVWDTAAAEAVMADPAAGQAMIDALAARAAAEAYGGYVLDFESLTPRGLAAYAPFLARLHAALKPAGRELWVTATLATDPATLQALAQASDAVVLMAYDQCWATSTPGPIAGLDWLTQALDARLPGLDPAHVVVALGAYGYDWPQNADGTSGVAQVLSATQAQALAAAQHATIARNAAEANPHFTYSAGDGRSHQVWWLDAAAFQAERTAALARHVRGVAIWRLGLEDPALWNGRASGRPVGAPAPSAPDCAPSRH